MVAPRPGGARPKRAATAIIPPAPASGAARAPTALEVDRQVMARMAQANADLMVRVLRGDEPVEGDPVMVALATARSLGVVVEDILRGLVVQARRDGRTWAEIGDVLHVTRQAVLQRFGGASAAAATATTAAPLSPRPVRSAGPKAVELLKHFFNRRWDELRAHFNQQMLDGCSVELLASVRGQIPGVAGEAVDIGTPHAARLGEHTNVEVPLTFHAPLAFGLRHATGRVVFDAVGKVAGFFILPQSTPTR
jgi:hypothetical protein